jgi:hypothetical protein
MTEKLPPFHVVFVLDRSGSMSSLQKRTIEGVNEYISGLKKTDGDAKFTLATFSSGGGWGTDNPGKIVEYLVDGTVMADVDDITEKSYDPAGGTPLYDAIGMVVDKVEKSYSKKKKKPRFLMMIMTDGHENSSTKYTREDISTLIKRIEEEGWQVGYMGANQDAWAVASSIGIRKGNSMNYKTTEIRERIVQANLVTSDARRAHPAQVMWPGEQDQPEDSK